MADAPPPPDRNHTALTAYEIVRILDLAPHPEGGYYRETFRDTARLPGTDRALSTAIYFLLPAGIVSRWHTVDAVETWHWYAGAPLLIAIAPPGGGTPHHVRLGPDLAAAERPQAVVPTGHWQRAQSTGAWTLVGCTVAPGFEFSGFAMPPAGWSPEHGPMTG